jgi:hypothetical protein
MYPSAGDSPEEEKKGYSGNAAPLEITEEVRSYILTAQADFRVCTSCGGPILLPVSVKRPKASDLRIPVGTQILYVSRYQAPFLSIIDGEMIPHYLFRNRHVL